MDDGLAIIMALNSPELEVGAVTGIYGNTSWQHVRRNLHFLRSLFPAAQSFPIWMGAMGPADFAHNVQLPGIMRLARFIREHPGDVTLVPIGPLTNVALLFAQFPDVVPLLRGMSIMGGYLNKFEFNFGNDGPATDFVLQASVPKHVFGFEVCLQQRFTTAHYAELRKWNTPRTRYLLRNIRSWLWINRLASGGSLRGGFHPFDPTAIAYLIQPSLFTFARVPARHAHKNKGPLAWRVGGTWTYIDSEALATRQANTWWTHWGLKVNSLAFMDLLLSRLH